MLPHNDHSKQQKANSKSQKEFFLLSAICCLLSAVAPRLAQAATINAASCNVSDVQTAINAASNGDTVIIPNGSCSWASGITTSKQITLQGQSVGGVTITDTNPNGCSSGCTPASYLLTFTIGNSFHTTIANLRFMPGTGTGVYMQINGSGLVPLMHDCYFNLPNFQLFLGLGWFVKGGVIWNTTFQSTDLTSPVGGSDSGCLQAGAEDGSWDTPSTMGVLDTNGDKNLYIEDSIFDAVGQCPDVIDNGRVVIRHSQIIGSSGSSHGPTGVDGGRQTEFYNNVYSFPNTARALSSYFWWRAGTAVVTANSIQWISGAMWGDKPSFAFSVENAARAANWGCVTGYMGRHQPGSGSSLTVQSPSKVSPGQTPDDVFQLSDPIYMWNNTGTGDGLAHIDATKDGEPRDCFGINPATRLNWTTSDFFKLNRDYFVNNGAKPGWAPYTYPHPLRGGVPPPPPPASSPCDVNGDGVTNVADVQLEVNMALGITPCTNPSGTCTVVSVQRVVNAALGGTCVAP